MDVNYLLGKKISILIGPVWKTFDGVGGLGVRKRASLPSLADAENTQWKVGKRMKWWVQKHKKRLTNVH